MPFADVNSKLLSRNVCCLAVQALLVIFSLLIWNPAHGATNFLNNPGFESPLGPTNWTLGYLWGGPSDFEIKGRTTIASRSFSTGRFGGHLRPAASKLCHAYLAQSVTNLTLGYQYNVSGYMREDWWSNPTDHAFRDKFLVYIEAIGGLGTPTGDGRFSRLATNYFTPDSNIDAPYTYPTDVWREFKTKQTPDTNGRIEIRLHLDKVGFTTYDKLVIVNGYFDLLSLSP